MNGYRFTKIILLLLIPFVGISQSDGGMLIFQIDGNRYFRKNFNGKNKLMSYQSIEVGSLKKDDQKIEAKLTVITYDADDNMKGASQTVISCNPDASEVMMGIFPFAGGATNKSLKIALPKNKKLYPSDWQGKNSLDDFDFQLKFQDGAAGFFGTESQVVFSERKVVKIDEGTFRISGKMKLKAYVIGINISTINYDYWEEIKNGVGIVRQKFSESNGNYFAVELKK